MRKILSMAMLLLLALPLVAPALGQTAQQRLLLCCRKGGAHHCMTSLPTDGTMLRAHCAACPKAAATGQAAGWMEGGDDARGVTNSVASLRVRQVEAGHRISFGRSRQKRGPPAMNLS